MTDDNQLPLPASFVALFVPKGASRPTFSRAHITGRYALCEDMALMLTEPAQAHRFELGIDEATVLQRMLRGLLSDPLLGDPSLGNPSVGDLSPSDPSLGDPSLGNPSLGNPSPSDPSLRETTAEASAEATQFPPDRAPEPPSTPTPAVLHVGEPTPAGPGYRASAQGRFMHTAEAAAAADPAAVRSAMPSIGADSDEAAVFSAAEAAWVIRRLAELLNWPPLPYPPAR